MPLWKKKKSKKKSAPKPKPKPQQALPPVPAKPKFEPKPFVPPKNPEYFTPPAMPRRPPEKKVPTLRQAADTEKEFLKTFKSLTYGRVVSARSRTWKLSGRKRLLIFLKGEPCHEEYSYAVY